VKGIAHIFGEDISTDVILPTDYTHGSTIDYKHVFDPVRPGFADEIERGDMVVAGKNFGCGSSRESAPIAIQLSGVSAVVAESFSRIFYRNAIAIGLPVITAKRITDFVSEGNEIEINLDTGVILNNTTGVEIEGESMPREIQSIFEAGGLIKHYKLNKD
jgi:3-isopropylmalate/(R)-2-methylmalate dehydratase small subunit